MLPYVRMVMSLIEGTECTAQELVHGVPHVKR